MAVILRYFAEFSSFRGQLRKSGRLAIDRRTRAVLFAVAELLVYVAIS